jgi:hypothetical protein
LAIPRKRKRKTASTNSTDHFCTNDTFLKIKHYKEKENMTKIIDKISNKQEQVCEMEKKLKLF